MFALMFAECDIEGCSACSDKGGCVSCMDKFELSESFKCEPVPVDSDFSAIIIGEWINFTHC